MQPIGQCAVKTFFLVCDRLQNIVAFGQQILVVVSHLIDHRVGDRCQKRLVEAKDFAKSCCAAQDHAQDILAAFVAGQDAVSDQEGAGAHVVCDRPIAEEVCLALCVAVAGQLLDACQDRDKGVGVVVVVLALQDAGQPFQTGSGVDAGGGQRHQLAIWAGVVLHEDQVPDFQVFVVFVDAAWLLAGQVTPVVMDLGAGAAGAGVPHRPPVVFLAETQHPCGVSPLLSPQPFGVVILCVDGEPQPFQGQAQFFDQQLPGKADGVRFEVVAEGKVAQHLKKGMVAWAGSDVFEVVVFAADPHAFLCGRSSLVAALLDAQECIFELVHPGVGQQQGRVVFWHQAAAGNHFMPLGAEVVQKKLADFAGLQWVHCRPSCLFVPLTAVPISL